jgi:UDP-glucuronate decarboxylase
MCCTWRPSRRRRFTANIRSSRSTRTSGVFFSSSEIYGDPAPSAIPTNEEYRGNVSCTGPRACYDEAKRFGETLCWVFANTFGTPVRVVRPFNNYGPGMALADRRAPADFAQCVLNGQNIVILSSGTPTRTFCYVADAVAGYFKALLHDQFEAFNIGIEKPEITVRQLAEHFSRAGQKLTGYPGKVIFEASADKDYLTHNPERRCPDITKARTKLNFQPSIYVEQGVERFLKFLWHEQKNPASR